jgi:hypothetical protein
MGIVQSQIANKDPEYYDLIQETVTHSHPVLIRESKKSGQSPLSPSILRFIADRSFRKSFMGQYVERDLFPAHPCMNPGTCLQRQEIISAMGFETCGLWANGVRFPKVIE